jgi:hypothetical protein
MFKLWTKALADALRPAGDVPAVEIRGSRISRFLGQGNAKSKPAHITEVIHTPPCENRNSLLVLDKILARSVFFKKDAKAQANSGLCPVDAARS